MGRKYRSERCINVGSVSLNKGIFERLALNAINLTLEVGDLRPDFANADDAATDAHVSSAHDIIRSMKGLFGHLCGCLDFTTTSGQSDDYANSGNLFENPIETFENMRPLSEDELKARLEVQASGMMNISKRG